MQHKHRAAILKRPVQLASFDDFLSHNGSQSVPPWLESGEGEQSLDMQSMFKQSLKFGNPHARIPSPIA